MKIDQLFDLSLYQQMVDEGYVVVRTHPEFANLKIAGYSEKAAYERKWNEVTRICRGLVYDADTYEVISRSFAKFWNWDEPESPRITEDVPVYAWSNKEDGSLAISYRRPDGRWAITTRGSFESDQAIDATRWLADHDEVLSEIQEAHDMGYTALYEWVGPQNRIVLFYPEEALLPLGWVHIETGAYVPHHSFPKETRTMHDLLMDLDRNKEGWVVWLDPYKAVKGKEPGYIALHRIVTGLNRKSVWRALKDGTFRDLLEQLPDELYKWAETVAAELLIEKSQITGTVEALRREYTANPNITDRKSLAAWVNSPAVPAIYRPLIFTAFDGKSIDAKVWDMIEPKGDGK